MSGDFSSSEIEVRLSFVVSLVLLFSFQMWIQSLRLLPQQEMEMAFQAILQPRTEAFSLSFSSTLPTRRFGPYRSHLSLAAVTTKVPRLQVLAFAVKRSPKRLKYAAPRFTKVLLLLSLSLLIYILLTMLRLVWLPRKKKSLKIYEKFSESGAFDFVKFIFFCVCELFHPLK